MHGREALVIAALSAAVWAQDRVQDTLPPETTFRTTTDFVQLNVSVFDSSGKILKDLPESAFAVYENGVKQQIKVFRQEDVPVSLGLVIDNSSSMKEKRDRVASAALAMVKASNPEDEVFLIHFNEEPLLTQDFTSDVGTLEKGLRNIRSQGETAMRDALLLGIEHLRHRGKREKKVLVVITDGEDNSSVETQPHLIEAAHRNDVMIYGIGLLGNEPNTGQTKKQLEDLTLSTGGRAWFPNDVAEIANITPEIAHEIRNQYIIGYTPPEGPPGVFRPVKVTVNVPGAVVRTRAGYYSRR